MAYRDLARRTTFEEIMRDKAFNIAKNPKDDRYQRDLASVDHKCFVWKTSGKKING